MASPLLGRVSYSSYVRVVYNGLFCFCHATIRERATVIYCESDITKIILHLLEKKIVHRHPVAGAPPSEMGPIIYRIHADQRTDEWFIARGFRIGASSGAVVCGISPKIIPMSFWVKHYQPGPDPVMWAFVVTEPVAKGNLLEPVVRVAYELITGRVAIEAPMYINSECTWVHASPDGIVSERGRYVPDGDGLLEIKCPYWHMYGDTPPIEYVHQCLQQMWVAERPWNDLVAYYEPTNHFKCWRIYHCESWKTWALRRMRIFRDCNSEEEVQQKCPAFGKQAQLMLETDWSWQKTAHKYGCSIEYLKSYLPPEIPRIDRIFEFTLERPAFKVSPLLNTIRIN